MNKRQNIIIGLVVIIAIILFIIGFNFLKGKNLFNTNPVFYAKYKRIDGLSKSNYVSIKGFNVGKVIDIQFTDANAKDLIISFSIDKKYKIPKNTVAKIVTLDLMGSRSLMLEFPKEIDTINGYAQLGDTLIGTLEGDLKAQVSEQVLPLKMKAEELMSSIDSMVNIVQMLLNKKNRQNLSYSFASIKRTMNNLEAASGKIDRLMLTEQQKLGKILSNAESITSTLENNENKIENILTNFSNISDTLVKADFATTLVKAQSALDQITLALDKINKGEGTLGELIHDKDLYNNLENATMNLERLLADFKMNPKKYINVSLIGGKSVYYEKDGNKSTSKDINKKTFYRIQIYNSSTPVSLDNEIFKARTDINVFTTDDNTYKYTIGYENNYKKISRMLKKIKSDFPDAFIIEEK